MVSIYLPFISIGTIPFVCWLYYQDIYQIIFIGNMLRAINIYKNIILEDCACYSVRFNFPDNFFSYDSIHVNLCSEGIFLQYFENPDSNKKFGDGKY